MGLRDTITTLEARLQAGQDVAEELAIAYAEMASRKDSKRLFWHWFNLFATHLKSHGRYSELVAVAGGIDPQHLGVWDCQEAVATWLAQEKEDTK